MEKENYYDILRKKRRMDILETAKKTIVAKGIGKTKMCDLAKALGFSTVTLYKYFKSLDEILYAIEDDVIDKLNFVGFDHEPNTSPYEVILRDMNSYYQFFLSHKEDFLFMGMFDMYSLNDSGGDRHHGFLGEQDFSVLIEKSGLGQMKALGMTRPDLDPRRANAILYFILVSVVQRMALLEPNLIRKKNLSDPEIMEEMAQMFYRYLK